MTKFAFVQPFGFAQPGGGARILRAMTERSAGQVVSINTSPFPQPAPQGVRELHVPYRPSFGRLERTRFSGLLGHVARVTEGSFQRRLRATFRAHGVGAVHAVPHGPDVWSVFVAARLEGLRFYVSVHDDPVLMLRGLPQADEVHARFGVVWRDADARTVISEEMGRECCRRWGERPYTRVTDGLVAVRSEPRPAHSSALRVYFGGLMALGYSDNFRVLFDALKGMRGNGGGAASLTCRGGEPPVRSADVATTVKPWGPEAAMQEDFEEADVLYLPLPFGDEQRALARFSLSTKMVTYLASGLPILYHGPSDAAAARLLERHRAAAICTSCDAAAVRASIMHAVEHRGAMVANALSLAREEFVLDDVRKRFWETLGEAR